ncbi:type VII toxin-antitoxin system MntA family adenylyltransferase antitoxin [Perlucidibaca piscinae]|uniref:type VII toxin-antitoxin system MntA family adenylyltransferase antitoxin n=1 Tax=Perlucidibaca piscinae TaxID=392589 RepID=UPI0003B5CBA1|nr:nucleotidyltransferase domain-containing protein [Perlucidibaca piscinae]
MSDTLMRLREALPALLEQLEQPQLVVVFGSVAAGSAGFDSDLDLALQCRRALSAEQRISLTAWLAEVTGRPVDLIDLRVAGEPLRGQVIRHGIRLWGSDGDWADLGMRHVLDMADFVPLLQRALKERRDAWINS